MSLSPNVRARISSCRELPYLNSAWGSMNISLSYINVNTLIYLIKQIADLYHIMSTKFELIFRIYLNRKKM